MRQVQVEVRDWFELEVDDDVVDELMSASWQQTFYAFETESEMLGWLAWVVDRWNGPEHVDGLAGFTDQQIRVRHVDREREAVARV